MKLDLNSNDQITFGGALLLGVLLLGVLLLGAQLTGCDSTSSPNAEANTCCPFNKPANCLGGTIKTGGWSGKDGVCRGILDADPAGFEEYNDSHGCKTLKRVSNGSCLPSPRDAGTDVDAAM